MNTKEVKRNPQVDGYLKRAKNWRNEIEALREIILGCQLIEELKWGKPCYALEGSNVVIIMPLKESCALLFAKGALMKDPHGLLIQPTENTQAARQLRLTSLRQIGELATILKNYIQEATEIQKAGLEVTYKKISEFKVPEEFQTKLDESPELKRAFDALTPGRQRGYFLYFSAAKQSKTREARIEKCRQQILHGKGMNDE